jgi:hypothetical protein
MAITFDELKDLMDKEKLRYFVDPKRPVLMFGISGMFGKYHVGISLFDDGNFFQIRSINNIFCPQKPKPHEHWAAVQTVIGELNTRYRLVKFAWDPSDGEVICYADLWLMDSRLTQKQLNRMLSNYFPALDMGSHRIQVTMDSGTDPGEQNPAEIAKSLAGRGSGLPEPLRKLVEKLGGKKPDDAKKDESKDDAGDVDRL